MFEKFSYANTFDNAALFTNRLMYVPLCGMFCEDVLHRTCITLAMLKTNYFFYVNSKLSFIFFLNRNLIDISCKLQ